MNRVLHDQRVHALRVRNGEPHANGPAVILHEESVMREAELLGETSDCLGDMVVRVAISIGWRRVA